jgi:hypothetical protein
VHDVFVAAYRHILCFACLTACPDGSKQTVLTEKDLTITPGPTGNVYTVVLPNVGPVLPNNLLIMEIIVNGGGPITPFSVTPDNNSPPVCWHLIEKIGL